jgi:hypothetical protein
MAVVITSSTQGQEEIEAAARPDWREEGYVVVGAPPPEAPAGCRQAIEYKHPGLAALATLERQQADKQAIANYETERKGMGDEAYWAELTAQAGTILIPGAVVEQIQKMPHGGAQVAEYLAEHKAEAEMLAKLSPAVAHARVERIREKVTHDLGAMGMVEYMHTRNRAIADRKKQLLAKRRGSRG